MQILSLNFWINSVLGKMLWCMKNQVCIFSLVSAKNISLCRFVATTQ